MKPISSSSPLNGTGSDSRASPTSGVRAEGQLALGERRRSGELRCATTDDAADDLEQLFARQRQLVLEGVGQQLLVVGELAVDAAGRQRTRPPAREDKLVVVHAELELTGAGSDARDLASARAGTIASRSGAAPLDLRLA